MQQKNQKGRLTLKKKAIAKLVTTHVSNAYLPPTTIKPSYVITCKEQQRSQ